LKSIWTHCLSTSIRSGFLKRYSTLRIPFKRVICLTGCQAILLSSPPAKNIPLFTSLKSALQPAPSRPTRGAYRDRHGRGVGCGGRGSVGRVTRSQGGLWPVSDRRHADERRMRGRRSRVVLAPVAGVKLAEASRPDRARTKPYPPTTVAKGIRAPGRARRKPLKPLRAGMPGVPVDLW
jgi:hypothetical protein